MHFGRFPRKTLLAATLLLAFSSANASFVEQIGTPVTPLAVMGTYAADAAIKPGLKAVIPPGWQLFHHQSVELPSGLSWEKDDTWVSVLNKFAGKHDIAVLVDWDKKQVFFRSTSMALKEQEKRQIIAQAASTPLPAFKASETKPAPVLAAKPADKSLTSVTTVTTVAVSTPAPQVQAPSVTPVAAPVRAQVAATAVSASAPAAVAPAAVPAPAPITVAPPKASVALAASSPATSQPSTGVTLAAVPAAVTVPTPVPERVVSVEPAIIVASTATASPAKRSVRPPTKVTLATLTPATPGVEPKPAVAVLPAKSSVTVVSSTSASTVVVTPASGLQTPARTVAVVVSPAPALTQLAPAPAAQVVVAVPAPVTGAVAFNREPVSMVVAAAGAKHGYTVSWDASQVVFLGPVTLLGADMGEDMNLVLRALGGRRAPVGITVYRASNVVVVRDAATGSASVSFTDVPFSGRIREITASKTNSQVFAAAQPAPVPVPAVVRVTYPAPVAAPVYAAPRPAPVQAAPAYIAPAPVQPAVRVAPESVRVAAQPVRVAAEPVRVTPEPVRLDTAVATIKKMEPAQPLAAPVGRVVTLNVPAGGQLRDAIEAALEPGWSLKWEVKEDLVANSAMSASGDSLVAALNQVLPRLKLSADFYKPSKLVIVREADQALDK